ncbi:MAG: PEGA domain-containing protein [Myxococcaceae bacterium]|nr:PEGA domain-containing protein [Myxococcaceae bacterium]
MFSAVSAFTAAVALATGPIAIVDVDAPDAMMGLGAQVTRQLVDGAAPAGVQAMAPDQLRALLPPDKYLALRKCRESTPCVANALAGTSIHRVVTGALSRDERNYLVKLWHHDVKALTLVCDVNRSILIAGRRLQKDVEQAVPGLLRGEREARGTLIIETTVPNAQLSVNGEFVGSPPVTLTLKPGKYEVKLEKNKYLPVTRLVAVEANQTVTETLKLLLMPGQQPDEDPAVRPSSPGPRAAEPAGRSLSAPTWLFGALTLATGAATGAFAGLAEGQRARLLGGLDAMTGVYAGTRAQALEQNRNALIANVGLVALGVAAAATVVFLIIDLLNDAPEQPAPAKVTP